MRVARLKITNFKGVKSSELFFEGHTLLIGMNNVGKSTVCEALELVLGLDRLKRFSAGRRVRLSQAVDETGHYLQLLKTWGFLGECS